MSTDIKKLLSLVCWVACLIMIGGGIGAITRPEIQSWYATLNRSPLTPANYIFPIAWTILYGLIGAAGWVIWEEGRLRNLRRLKLLYLAQLVLNWSWSPLFFSWHLIVPALIVLLSINTLVALIIWQSWHQIKSVAILMIPYLLWGTFASYLNLYVWWHN